jgi:glycosyltransferase involved in cell wall biosynthesis
MAGAKKPLFILPNLTGGGAERATLQLLGRLRACGFDPTLLLMRREGALLTQVPEQLRVVCAMEAGAKLYWNAPRLMRKLLALARECDIIVGALELEPCYLAWLAGRITRRPVVGWIHAVMSEYLGKLSSVHRAMARQVYPRMDKLVFPSHASADSLAGLIHLERARIAVIPSHLDLGRLQALAAAPLPEWATELFRKPTIISVGRLVSSKGFEVLLRAHARLRNSGADYNLLILGEGPLRRELESLADRLEVRGSVSMPGFVANPYPLMKAAHVFVMASHFESMGMALLEAMALGCVIVATDSPGGTREVLRRERDRQACQESGGELCGWLVPVDDEAALADGIARMSGDPARRESMRASAILRVLDFNAETIIPQWERLLSEVS